MRLTKNSIFVTYYWLLKYHISVLVTFLNSGVISNLCGTKQIRRNFQIVETRARVNITTFRNKVVHL